MKCCFQFSSMSPAVRLPARQRFTPRWTGSSAAEAAFPKKRSSSSRAQLLPATPVTRLFNLIRTSGLAWPTNSRSRCRRISKSDSCLQPAGSGSPSSPVSAKPKHRFSRRSPTFCRTPRRKLRRQPRTASRSISRRTKVSLPIRKQLHGLLQLSGGRAYELIALGWAPNGGQGSGNSRSAGVSSAAAAATPLSAANAIDTTNQLRRNPLAPACCRLPASPFSADSSST